MSSSESAVSPELPASSNSAVPQPGPAAERRKHFRSLAASILLYLAFGLIVPTIHYHIHPMPRAEIIAIFVVPTLVFMFLQMWVPWCVVRIPQSLNAEIKQFAVFGVLWLLLMCGFAPLRTDRPGVGLFVGALSNLAQTLTLTLLGAMIARIVREAKILLPLGIVAGLIDIVGAMTPIGFTAHMVQRHPEVVSKVSVHVPTVAGLPVGTIGPGDLLFVAFFFAVVHQHRLNTRWTFRLVYAFLTLSMLAVQLGVLPQVGALAPMGVAVIIGNWKYFTFSREEKFAMLYASIICITLAIGFYLYMNAVVFRRQPTRAMTVPGRAAGPRAAAPAGPGDGS